MCTHDFIGAERDDALVICPQCGGSDYKDNRIDEALYREAAKEAPRLRFEGKIDEAVEVLTALYAIRIVNFVRPQWRCVCGASFDGYLQARRCIATLEDQAGEMINVTPAPMLARSVRP